jgi:hypothetical protein
MLLEFQNVVIRLLSAASPSCDWLSPSMRPGEGVLAGAPTPPCHVPVVYTRSPRPLLKKIREGGRSSRADVSLLRGQPRAPVHSVQIRRPLQVGRRS